MTPGILEIDGHQAVIDDDGEWKSSDEELASFLNVSFPPPATEAGTPWVIAFWSVAKLPFATAIEKPEPGNYPGDLEDIHEQLLESKQFEDIDEQAPLIAEILYHCYGDKALEHLNDNSVTESWKESDHPRGKGGRFIPRGSAEAVSAAKDVVRKALKGEGDAKMLANHLAILTVKQLKELHKENGVKSIPSTVLREHLVQAVLDKLTPASGKKEEPKAEPPEQPEPKEEPKPAAKAEKKPKPDKEHLDNLTKATAAWHAAINSNSSSGPQFAAYLKAKKAAEDAGYTPKSIDAATVKGVKLAKKAKPPEPEEDPDDGKIELNPDYKSDTTPTGHLDKLAQASHELEKANQAGTGNEEQLKAYQKAKADAVTAGYSDDEIWSAIGKGKAGEHQQNTDSSQDKIKKIADHISNEWGAAFVAGSKDFQKTIADKFGVQPEQVATIASNLVHGKDPAEPSDEGEGTAAPASHLDEHGNLKPFQANDKASVELAVKWWLNETGKSAEDALKHGNANMLAAKLKSLAPGITHYETEYALQNLQAQETDKLLAPQFSKGGASNKPNPALPNETRPNLTMAEKVATQKYTSSAFGPLNKSLREGRQLTGTSKQIDDGLKTAFAKTKPFPKPVTAYRGLTMTSGDMKKLLDKVTTAKNTPGGLYEFPCYASSSTGGYISGFKGNVTMEIIANQGLDLLPYTHYPHEREILLNNRSKYRVLEIQHGPGNKLHVKLEQATND